MPKDELCKIYFFKCYFFTLKYLLGAVDNDSWSYRVYNNLNLVIFIKSDIEKSRIFDHQVTPAIFLDL